MGEGWEGNAGFLPSLPGGRSAGQKFLNNNPGYTDAVHKAHRGIISGELTKNHTILAHELGHATGFGANNTFHIARGLSQAGNRLADLGRIYSGARAGGARTQEELDSARKTNRRVTALQIGTALPRLAEEARASIRAHGLAKKLTGQGVNKKLLGAAYGTYLANALAPAVVSNRLNEAMIRSRERQLREKARG